jgi:uncharacterized secreted protein with C-terminal beta-propeller domain
MAVTVGTSLARLKAILVAAAATTIIALFVWTVQVQAQTTTPAIGQTPR